MALVRAPVAAGEAPPAQLPTGELRLAAPHWPAQLATMAGCNDLAGAGGAGPRVAQQDTGMVTPRSQLPSTDVPTGVRGQPGVRRGVPLLATEAAILRRHLCRRVACAALRAAPGCLFTLTCLHPGSLWCGGVCGSSHLLTAPSLYAHQVKHTATAPMAVPDCSIIVHVLQADEAHSRAAACAVQLLPHALQRLPKFAVGCIRAPIRKLS